MASGRVSKVIVGFPGSAGALGVDDPARGRGGRRIEIPGLVLESIPLTDELEGGGVGLDGGGGGCHAAVR